MLQEAKAVLTMVPLRKADMADRVLRVWAARVDMAHLRDREAARAVTDPHRVAIVQTVIQTIALLHRVAMVHLQVAAAHNMARKAATVHRRVDMAAAREAIVPACQAQDQPDQACRVAMAVPLLRVVMVHTSAIQIVMVPWATVRQEE